MSESFSGRMYPNAEGHCPKCSFPLGISGTCAWCAGEVAWGVDWGLNGVPVDDADMFPELASKVSIMIDGDSHIVDEVDMRMSQILTLAGVTEENMSHYYVVELVDKKTGREWRNLQALIPIEAKAMFVTVYVGPMGNS